MALIELVVGAIVIVGSVLIKGRDETFEDKAFKTMDRSYDKAFKTADRKITMAERQYKNDPEKLKIIQQKRDSFEQKRDEYESRKANFESRKNGYEENED